MPKSKAKPARRTKTKFIYDGLPPRTETLEEFLRRGGKVTKCPPVKAATNVSGAFSVEGEVCITALGEPEYIPNYVVSEATYVAAQYDRPDVLISHAWREVERQSLPRDLGIMTETRIADSDEWTGEELYTNYFDEVEPEEAQA